MVRFGSFFKMFDYPILKSDENQKMQTHWRSDPGEIAMLAFCLVLTFVAMLLTIPLLVDSFPDFQQINL